MNKRLLQFLSAENISQAQFADTIDVARASVSHIIAGRNKPGFDFIESMALHYPSLNLEWLITGKGKMYISDPSNETDTLDNSIKQIDNQRKIVKIVVFFDDQTFPEYF